MPIQKFFLFPSFAFPCTLFFFFALPAIHRERKNVPPKSIDQPIHAHPHQHPRQPRDARPPRPEPKRRLARQRRGALLPQLRVARYVAVDAEADECGGACCSLVLAVD